VKRRSATAWVVVDTEATKTETTTASRGERNKTIMGTESRLKPNPARDWAKAAIATHTTIHKIC